MDRFHRLENIARGGHPADAMWKIVRRHLDAMPDNLVQGDLIERLIAGGRGELLRFNRDEIKMLKNLWRGFHEVVGIEMTDLEQSF